MTPAEFKLCIEAHNANEEGVLEKLAWVQSNIMTMWAKKGHQIKISDLLKKNGDDDAPIFLTVDDFREYMREKQRRIEEREAG